MQAQQLREYISHFAPVQPDEELIEQLLLQGSQITFEQKNEVLFKSGDPALGVYWILAGKARIDLGHKNHLRRGPGDMVGLDSFLARERIDFPAFANSQPLVTLFLNGSGLELFQRAPLWQAFLQDQLLDLLRAYKSQIHHPSHLSL